MDDYMDHSSGEDSDGNDSEVEEFAEKSYMELKGGKKRVNLSDQTFTCPYCTNKKKRDYNFFNFLKEFLNKIV
ncbi:putative domain XH, Zinc finger-XS domain protein [Artemisia annua]|uniref:Putative domain XH, Zinc finger-XS domain protein n=1 Tax=Artemisia annua TaxID=35608 RepID=A0A2U1LBY4_ARTAN|nr:putative domain XH, Zinc finger-XS domain protein [Artemisia annua]